MNNIEEHRTIKEFPSYLISSYGRVWSCKSNRFLNPQLNGRGYLHVTLTKNGKKKTLKIHKLVAIEFLDHNPDGQKIVVDHIDDNPINNNLNNLQLITNRQNTNKHNNDAGVYYVKSRKKWNARAWINGKHTFLGSFDKKEDALNKYRLTIDAL